MPEAPKFHMDDCALCQVRFASGDATDWRMYVGEVVRHNQCGSKSDRH